MSEAKWLVIVILAAVVSLASPAPTAATPGPTPTPPMVLVTGTVFKPGPDGLEPAAGVSIISFNPAQTNSEGRFSAVLISPHPPFLVQAVIDQALVRTFATSAAKEGGRFSVIIDPISEAAVRLLEGDGRYGYLDDGVTAVLEGVRAANAGTSFAGLTLSAAIDVAVQTAAADPAVQALIDQAIQPTPTVTLTPTVTPTNTRRATATPRPCAGDCDRGGSVSVDEIVAAVTIALGAGQETECAALFTADRIVDVTDVVRSITNALEGCTLPQAAADLVVEEMRLVDADCTAGFRYMRVCVANVGEIASGPFEMTIASLFPFRVGGFEAGDGLCLTIAVAQGSVLEVEVDVRGEVDEISEDNNLGVLDLSGAPALPTCTPPASPTPT